MVKEIIIAKDLKHVIATAELKKGITPYLVEDTRFWVVRPQISGGNITGLGTLMGGSYIGFDIGKSKTATAGFHRTGKAAGGYHGCAGEPLSTPQ